MAAMQETPARYELAAPPGRLDTVPGWRNHDAGMADACYRPAGGAFIAIATAPEGAWFGRTAPREVPA